MKYKTIRDVPWEVFKMDIRKGMIATYFPLLKVYKFRYTKYSPLKPEQVEGSEYFKVIDET